ncbi:MAG: PKD domain-containing protein, partial [Bacteroidota bacterium]
MKGGFLYLLCFILIGVCWPLRSWAQLPPNQPEQDCFGALSICQDVYIQTDSYRGAGRNPDEINTDNSCFLIGERNSVWYTFTVQSSGNLCFTIVPFDTLDDYDWAVYNITGGGCNSVFSNPGAEVGCNWTFNNGCQGRTGPNGLFDCPGQSDPCIPVTAGQTYVINVSNFSATNSGYTLDLSASSAQLYDDVPPNATGLSSFCYGVNIDFDENIQCATVDPSDFTFTGPDGPYVISEIRSENCDNGGRFDTRFGLVVSPPIQQPGMYTLSLVGAVADLCGNTANTYSNQVYMPQPPVAAMNSHDPQCLGENVFGFGYTGPSTVRNYIWDFGDGSRTNIPNPVHSYEAYGDYQVRLIIVDNNGCTDTAETPITVWPKPRAVYALPDQICQYDTATLENRSQELGGSVITQYNWFLADGGRYNTPDITHTFTYAGPQTVLLEAFNTFGCRDTFSRRVRILPAPEPWFEPEQDVCYGDIANFENLSTIRTDIAEDRIVSWSWNLGDSTELNAIQAISHLYDTAGIFPVTLRAVSDKGCVDSVTRNQIIHRPHAPDVDDTPVCFGERAFLEAAPDSGGITYWYWAPDGDTPFHDGASFITPPVAFADTFWTEVISPRGCISERVPVIQQHYPLYTVEIAVNDSVLDFPDPLLEARLTTDVPASS